MEENALADAMKKIGYRKILRESVGLPNGKALIRIDFKNIKIKKEGYTNDN